MNSQHDSDRTLSRSLAEIGPDIPEPSLDAEARQRLQQLIAERSPPRAPAGRTATHARRALPSAARWLVTCGTGAIAAALAIACTVLYLRTERLEARALAAESSLDEATGLLLAVRQAIAHIAPPDDLTGLRESNLVLVNFHHDMCPVARFTTPRFQQMAARHADQPVRFVSLNLTGPHRNDALAQVEALGIGNALNGPPGSETGVVKVLDLATGRVLCAGAGEQAIQDAESLLERIAALDRAP